MILDNSDKKTVYKWLEKNAETGEMDIVTGYFTVGALCWLSEKFNEKINKLRLICGSVAANDTDKKNLKINLLSQDIGIEKALALKHISQKAADFLKQNKVNVKTSDPNFCHAKMFLQHTADDRHTFYLTGSSNLTESGIGQRHTSNVELNIADTGEGNEYKELAAWFNNIWTNNDKVHDAKQRFINEISKIFKEYTPNDIYLKILSEILPDEIPQKKVEQTLKNSEIYKTLFDFQKKAVVSLIRMLENKNGAVLADAVGLGKTFTALAVIKYYQKQGRETIVLAPKKLEYNWEQYKKTNSSIFENDDFNYMIKFHTDLSEERLSDKINYLTNEKPKLFVIDESHNLRNDKGVRYKFLLENILRKNDDAKVLMLSATPINNSLLDVRNQFKLIGEFDNIDHIFRKAQEELNKWADDKSPRIGNLIKNLHRDLFNLTDSLIVARTRKMVENDKISFPELEKPENIYETPKCVKDAETIYDLTGLLPVRFSAYMPAYYAGLTSDKIVHDESRRSFFLVKMMHILLVKRLESSWLSFKITLGKILEYHKDVLRKLKNAEDLENDSWEELWTDEDSAETEEQTVGKRQKIKISDIKEQNMLDRYKADLNEDIVKLQNLLNELANFTSEKDTKLKRLIDLLTQKQQTENPKALIFTTYSDTAEYLFTELKKHFDKIERVTGDTPNKQIESILKRFSPVSKNADKKQSANPINILIATDVLSEGQNLQDCDFVANYDIHWNPVRAIQRLGRIDRIGSKNKTIRCANFWPSKNINEYLKLQERIETRMATMIIAGAQIPADFTDKIGEISRSDELEKKQTEKNLIIMQNNLSDIENETLGMNNLSAETFRQDLTNETVEKYKSMPNGIFSGFKTTLNGMIALLQNRNDKELKLILIDKNGKELAANRYEILQLLQKNMNAERYVPQPVDNCDEQEIKKYAAAINNWFDAQIPQMTTASTRNLFAGILPPNNFQECVEEKYIPDNWNLICWEIIGNEP